MSQELKLRILFKTGRISQTATGTICMTVIWIHRAASLLKIYLSVQEKLKSLKQCQLFFDSFLLLPGLIHGLVFIVHGELIWLLNVLCVNKQKVISVFSLKARSDEIPTPFSMDQNEIKKRSDSHYFTLYYIVR